jgi:hypothetical protein
MATFKVQGTVKEAESGRGLSRFGVVLQEKEVLLDDLLGGTVTDEKGHFEITSELENDGNYFVSVLNFIILTPDGRKLPYSVKKTVRWEAGCPEEVDLKVPREILIDRKRDDIIAVEQACRCMGQGVPDRWLDSPYDGFFLGACDTNDKDFDDADWDDLTGLLIP